jgi:hypothetical protein
MGELNPSEQRQAAIAASAIREVAKRLTIEDDAGLQARFEAACRIAPRPVLMSAFRQARATLVNDSLKAVVAELQAAYG